MLLTIILALFLMYYIGVHLDNAEDKLIKTVVENDARIKKQQSINKQ